MWTDIDHYDLRRTFTLDEQRFPITRMREIVDYLHRHQQQYVVIVDPAVAHLDSEYPTFSRGKEMDVFLKDPHAKGEYFRGVVWPVSIFHDQAGPSD
jgi:alpha-glucosidase